MPQYLEYIKELEENPKNNLIWGKKMLFEVEQLEFDKAFESFKGLIKAGLTESFLYDLKNLLVDIDILKAIELYDLIIPLLPDIFVSPYFERGKLHFSNNDFQKALRDFNISLEHNFDIEVANYKVMTLMKIDGSEAEKYANQVFEEIDKFLKDPEVLELPKAKVYYKSTKADILVSLKRYEEALKIYDEITDNDPDEYVAWYKKEDIYRKLGDTKKIIKLITERIKRSPKSYMLYARRAIMFKKEGDIDSAIEDFSKIIELKDFKGGYNVRGQFFHNLHRYDEAISDYNKALEFKDGLISRILFNKGNAYYSLKKYDKALECFEEGLKTEEDKNVIPQFYERKATILLKQGKYDKAEEWFFKSLEGNPNFYGALYNLACCYSLKGDTQKAIEFLKKANEVSSKAFEEAKTDLDFDNIRNNEDFKNLIG